MEIVSDVPNETLYYRRIQTRCKKSTLDGRSTQISTLPARRLAEIWHSNDDLASYLNMSDGRKRQEQPLKPGDNEPSEIAGLEQSAFANNRFVQSDCSNVDDLRRPFSVMR